MDCRSARRLVSRYLDRELTEELARVFGEHIAACPECRRSTEELEAVMELIEKPAEVAAPARLYRMIRDRLPDSEPVPRLAWWKPVLVPALAAAAFILTALASANLIPRIFASAADRQLQVTSANMDLSIFNDAPQSSLAGVYNKMTGD